METRLWREMLLPYYDAVDELCMKFEHMIQECRTSGEYVPFENVEGRVKKIASILEKAQKKNVEIDNIEECIQDIAGVRIICQFVEDIRAVVDRKSVV